MPKVNGVMKIRVELVGQFRDIVGSTETLIDMKEGSTVYDLVKKMADKYGKRFKERVFSGETERLSEDFTIVLDGRVVPVDEAQSTVLNETSRVVLMPEAII
ncbi:MAG: MoaD/ThiS family protein [Thaumarchaeota archaeon]|nr:MoaD/ThiS family protein [Nitrososphaerota archaeon]